MRKRSNSPAAERNGDTRYLRQRRGRWLVQIAVPSDLRDRYGKANVERYLGTSSLPEAKRLRHAAVAEIFASFDRAREGGPIRPNELKAQAEAELRRAYDTLAADFLDSHGRLPDLAREVAEDATDLVSASFQTNRLLGKPTTEYAEDVLDRIGVTKTEESVAALSQAILKAHAAALAMLERGIEPPPLKGQPVRRKRQGTAPRVSELEAQYEKLLDSIGDDETKEMIEEHLASTKAGGIIRKIGLQKLPNLAAPSIDVESQVQDEEHLRLTDQGEKDARIKVSVHIEDDD